MTMRILFPLVCVLALHAQPPSAAEIRAAVDRAVQNVSVIDPVASDGWAVLAVATLGYGKSLVPGIYVRRMATQQRDDGHFVTSDMRPPQSYGDFYATATAVRAIAAAMPDKLAAEKSQ